MSMFDEFREFAFKGRGKIAHGDSGPAQDRKPSLIAACPRLFEEIRRQTADGAGGVHVKKAARMHKISSSKQSPRASHPGFPEELQKTSTAVTTARINIAKASASMFSSRKSA